MPETPVELSIVMPAYNEEVAIAAAVDDILTHVVPAVASAEIVVVNDGSKDRTLAILHEIAAREPRLTVINRVNGGHGPALITGLDAARGETLLLLDSDRQIVLDDFAAAWAAYRTGDALIGIRADRHDGPLRAVISRGMRIVLRVLFGKAPRDPNIPFKIVKRADWRRAAPAIGADNPLPSVLLALYLTKSGARIVQYPITHRAREGSVSELRGWKRYPVKNQETVTPAAPEQRNVASTLHPLEKGARFKGRMRFHNLRPVELGGLLWALTWGGDATKRHALGMGKPLGFGQISVEIDTAASQMQPNAAEATPAIAELIETFRQHMEAAAKKAGKPAWQNSAQLRELLAMADPDRAQGKNLTALHLGKSRDNEFVNAKKERLVLPVYTQIRPQAR